MSPTHANKRGVRYRYYVSHAIACLLRPATPSSLSGLSDYRGGRVRGRYRAEPNTLESYGLRVTILMAVSILSR
jgi:hypothetical protein